MDEQDLVDVGKLMFNNMEYKLSPDAEPALRECVIGRTGLFIAGNCVTTDARG